MPCLRLTVSRETQIRLNAVAPAYGGRAALLKSLLEQATGRLDPLPAPKGRPLRTFVRLTPAETEAVIAQAAACGLKVSTWIRTLVRRRVFGEPRFPRSEELALYAIHDQLGELARELRRLNQGLGDEASGAPIRPLILQVQTQVGATVEGLRQAFGGNLAYWQADREERADARV
ncbi:MAG TPA: hypothetical protein VEA79_08035 [Phenylobacterium sp.]|nr:hypothetical protein [Phenylobacterium sp.]